VVHLRRDVGGRRDGKGGGEDGGGGEGVFGGGGMKGKDKRGEGSAGTNVGEVEGSLYKSQGAGGLGNFVFISGMSFMMKLLHKAWKRAEEVCGGDKGEGAVVRLVVLGEE